MIDVTAPVPEDILWYEAEAIAEKQKEQTTQL